MSTLKKLLNAYPEYYLIILILLTGYTPPFSINPFVVIITIGLILQIVFNSRVIGIFIAGIFILVNLYMFAALISEFWEMPAFNLSAKQLLFVGLSLILFNLFTAGVMIRRYMIKSGHRTTILT